MCASEVLTLAEGGARYAGVKSKAYQNHYWDAAIRSRTRQTLPNAGSAV